MTPQAGSTHRRPRWIYERGVEPDPRFTLANERTFLAWIRTAVAVSALGYALRSLSGEQVDAVIGRSMLALAAVACIAGWFRWARAERALRLGLGLPAPLAAAAGAVLLAGGLALLAAAQWR